MGITGLLPFLEKASKKCCISDFFGCTVAVDTYCWLHKGAFSCADKLARGEFTDAHIKYCMKYVNMLLSHSIKPILVFDGRHLPAKAMTEQKRRESRNTAKKRAAELLRLGQIEEARSYMRRSVDITHEMALQLIKQCRQRNVDCIVAPYEADAQMAYLNKINVAQLIITEDSDLILFGCNKIFFKMDLNGNGVLVESCKLPLVMKCPLEHYSFSKFRQMCIMSGCDYLSSLPGIGLAKARQFINATRDPDIRNALRKLPSYFNKLQMVVSDEYRDGFMKAEATFKHQLVYDPLQRKLVPLNELEDEGTDPEMCSNAGASMEPDVAFQLALGNLDPFSLKKMDDWHPDHHAKPSGGRTNGWNQNSVAPHKSIWIRGYSEHLKKSKVTKSIKDHMTAISIPSTRALTTKLIHPKCEDNKEKGLTIEDLSSIYCIKQSENRPIKRHIIVEETQDFESVEVFENLSKNPFSLDRSKYNPRDLNIPLDDVSSNKKRRLSIENEKTSPDTSPILENKKRNYRRMFESHSFLKYNRLSKFQKTSLDTNNLVESKFFNSLNSDLEIAQNQNNLEKESILNISGIAALNVEDSDIFNSDELSLGNEISDVNEPLRDINSVPSKKFNADTLMCSSADEVTHKSVVSIVQSPVEYLSKFNPIKKCVLKIINDSEDSYNENTYPLEDLVTPVASQAFSENTEEPIPRSPKKIIKPNVTRSQPLIRASNISQNNPKKSCRRPGLQRKNSTPVLLSQQSLLTNFGFHKKSQLEH